MLARWVEARRFSTTRRRPGYDQKEVDAFLDEIRDSFLGVRQPSLTSEEIRGKRFSTTRLRPGYDEPEVDAFLDEAELRLPALVLAWRVCIAFGDLPRSVASYRQAVIPALDSRLGDHVAVSSSATQIVLYAPSIGLADEAAQVARELLAQHHISAPVRTEFWSLREQEWRDAADEPPADTAAQRHADRQEAERKRSVMTGVPAWKVRVEVASHRDVIALAEHLTARGWRVRRRPRSLIVWANCEDDAKGLGRALSGEGCADTDTAFRVRRVSYMYMYNVSWTD
jgi:DivIVA domain-containing protein